jgi:ribosomal protein S3AE
MNTLKIVQNNIQAIKIKLLTRENTSSNILARIDNLTNKITPLKKKLRFKKGC